jgi:hypothetical protein
MMEVAVHNGRAAGEQDKAARLEAIAAEMNRELVACGLALNNALDHALEVGRLLDEVKTILPHKEYTPWVVANFAGSDRTARAYRRLWVGRDKIEAKRQRAAVLSIADALHFLKQLEPPRTGDPALGVPKPPPGAYPDPDVMRAWEEEQAAQAEYKQAEAAALAELRAAERLTELCDVIKVLDQLVPKYPPGEAGAALAAWTGEGRALTVLHDSIAWLQRVLEEADTMHDREG